MSPRRLVKEGDEKGEETKEAEEAGQGWRGGARVNLNGGNRSPNPSSSLQTLHTDTHRQTHTHTHTHTHTSRISSPGATRGQASLNDRDLVRHK